MDLREFNLGHIYSYYKDWVRKNPQTASDIESTIKWLSYFVAGKINKSVVLTELIYCASNLLVLFNDIILQSTKVKIDQLGEKIKIWLSVLEYSEVFVELSCKKIWGEKAKWIVVACVQLLKCVAKLMLLLHFNEKLISCPPVIPLKRNVEKTEKHFQNRYGNQTARSIAFLLKRSGRVIRKVESAPSLHNRLWRPPSFASSPVERISEETQPDKLIIQQHLIGEIIFTIKPLIALGTIIKYGPSAWKPWLLSAAADLISLYLLQSTPRNESIRYEFTAAQRLEISRRRLSLLLYLMRSPFYEKHTKDRMDGFLNGLSRNIPLAKIICEPLRQYIPHWQEIYFYLWSS